MIDLYADWLNKLVYDIKQKLPRDFPIRMRADGPEDLSGWYVIELPHQELLYSKEQERQRTGEEMRQIITELVHLKNLIRGLGYTCEIEKNWTD